MDPLSSITSPVQSFRLPDAVEYLPLDGREHAPLPLGDGVTDTRNLEARLARAKETANAFEAIFIRQLLQTMRTAFGGESMFGSGTAGEIYGDMIDEALSETLSERGFLGISDMMYRRMIKDIGTANEGENGTAIGSRS